MNEITSALKIANRAIRAVKLMEILKKIVSVAAAVICGVLFIRLGLRKRL